MKEISSSRALCCGRIFFSLAVLQGITAIWVFINSRVNEVSLQSFSLEAVLILAAASSLLLFFGWQLFSSILNPITFDNRANRWINWIMASNHLGYLIIIFVTLLIKFIYILTLIPEVKDPFSKAILSNLSPIIAWFSGLCILVLLFLLYFYRQNCSNQPCQIKHTFWLMMGYFLLIIAGWYWLANSLYPTLSERVGWNSLGVPILEYQSLLVWGIGVFAFLLFLRFKTHKSEKTNSLRRHPWLLDLTISIILWISAVVLWQSQPIQPNWFVSERLAPNFEYYPYSDARTYDENAQSALVGNGFLHYNNVEIRRPLHAAYLTVLHLLGGQRYETVIFLQILVLALLPVGIYLVTRSIHNRISGVMASILLIIRETNSIAIGGSITSSHAKLIMVDMFATLFVVFFVYWSVRWIKQIDNPHLPVLLSGGTLGLAMLVRSETVVLSFAPLFLSAAILIPRKQFRRWLKHVIIFIAGSMLVISPWMVRNWQRTGRLSFDSASFRQLLIMQRFRPLEESQPSPSNIEQPITPAPNNGQAPLSVQATQTIAEKKPTVLPAPVNGKTPDTTTALSLLDAAIKKPGELIRVFASHYLNNQMQMLLIHPATYRAIDSGINFLGHHQIDRYLDECCSITEYTRRLPFWKKWDGQLPQQSHIPILITIIILAVGVAESHSKKSKAGLLPAAVAFLYILFNSALRNSGGRYLIPVDWVSILYYSIGSCKIILCTLNLILPAENLEEAAQMQTVESKQILNGTLLRSPRFILAAFGLLAIGISVPLIERSIPNLYPADVRDQMLNALLSPESNIPADIQGQFQYFLENGGKAWAGRGMYPQFFKANYGTLESDTGPRSPKPYPRLVFNFISTFTLDITLPVDSKIEFFPNSSDTLVLFCFDSERVRADPLAAAIFDRSGHIQQIFIRSPLPEKPSCPLNSDDFYK